MFIQDSLVSEVIFTLHRHPPIPKILNVKDARAWVSMDFTYNKFSATRTIEKIKILGAVLELLAKQG